MMRHVISLIGNENYIQITTKMSTNENYYNIHYGVERFHLLLRIVIDFELFNNS